MGGETFEIEEMIDRYADTVYRVALVQLKNPADAEDIFQDVFVKLMGNLHKLTSREHVKAWLIRVTINCCKSHFRSAWVRKTGALSETQAAPVPEESWELLEAVHRLPEKYRSVIYMFYYEGYSVEEMADILKRKAGTIKSDLFRGRKLLKRELGEEEFDE